MEKKEEDENKPILDFDILKEYTKNFFAQTLRQVLLI